MGGILAKKVEAAEVDTEAFDRYRSSPVGINLLETLYAEEPTEKIFITNRGFSSPEITIIADESVEWQWSCVDGPGYSVIQAINDGEHLKPVPGGFSSGVSSMDGKFRQRFALPGIYHFIAKGLTATPMKIKVLARSDYKILVNENGFHPCVLMIPKGRTVHFHWKDDSMQHAVTECLYCTRHQGFMRTENGNKLATLFGNFVQTLSSPGIYYYQTPSPTPGSNFLCAIHVFDLPREHTIEILDRTFSPMYITIEQGDRIWFRWDKETRMKEHCVYQVKCPEFGQSAEDSLQAIPEGFRWPTPSASGLITHIFDQPGVYYYSDQTYEAFASYMGVIVVLPKPTQHFFEVTNEGIKPDIDCVECGSQLWFVWNLEKVELSANPFVMEVERCLVKTGTVLLHNPCKDTCELVSEGNKDIFERLQVQMASVGETGVYQFRLANSAPNASCLSVIATPAIKDHFVTVSDDGYEPRVLALSKGDRIWFSWENTQAPHNVIQITHDGEKIDGGFCSGAILESPNAFCHQFNTAGIFYFRSQTLPTIFGVIAVATPPVIIPIFVNNLTYEATLARVFDVVCWLFPTSTAVDLNPVVQDDDSQLFPPEKTFITPRRCVARLMAKHGLSHYTSLDFRADEITETHHLMCRGTKVSTVVTDKKRDALMISLSRRGFTPSTATICKGDSVCWTWKRTAESHNIIYVSPPDSDYPLRAVEGFEGFASGSLAKADSFVHSFYRAGQFWIASQGAPGHTCCITVLGQEFRCDKPFIDKGKGSGVVDFGYNFKLGCNLADSQIYYTTDGSLPELKNPNLKLYHKEVGVVLDVPGYSFIRAVGAHERRMLSEYFISARYEVQKPTLDRSVAKVPDLYDQQLLTYNENQNILADWFDCVPTIKGYFPVAGTLEIIWSLPESVDKCRLIKGYQMYLNEVSYSPLIPPDCSSLRCSGLAGGKTYLARLSVFSNFPKCFPQDSNILTLVCPAVYNTGGPVISLRLTRDKDEINLVWKELEEAEIEGYSVCLNGDPQVPLVQQGFSSNQSCKFTMKRCPLNVTHKLFVIATYTNPHRKGLHSNRLVVTLPLDTSKICFPPPPVRAKFPPSTFTEFLTVTCGTHLQPAKSPNSPLPPPISPVEFVIASAMPEVSKIQSLAVALPAKMPPPNTQLFSRPEKSQIFPTPKYKLTPMGQTKAEEKGPKALVETTRKSAYSQADEKSVSTAEPVKKPFKMREKRAQPAEESVKFGQKSPVSRPKHIEISEEPRVLQSADKRGVEGGEINSDGYSIDGSDGDLPEFSQTKSLTFAPIQPSLSRQNIDEFGDFPRDLRISAVKQSDLLSIDTPRREEENLAIQQESLIAEVNVTQETDHSVKGGWILNRLNIPTSMQICGFVVSVVGVTFVDGMTSDLSYTTKLNLHGLVMDAVEHNFHCDKDAFSTSIPGLLTSQTYHFFVSVVYRDPPYDSVERTFRSEVSVYTTWGPPQSPHLSVLDVGEREVTVRWETRDCHSEVHLSGFKILIEEQNVEKNFSSDIRQSNLLNLTPGNIYTIRVVALTSNVDVGSSLPSNLVKILCPPQPDCPRYLSILPPIRPFVATITWPATVVNSADFGVIFYSVFVNGEFYTTVMAGRKNEPPACDIVEMAPGEVYEVAVTSTVGWSRVDPHESLSLVVCQTTSKLSDWFPFICSAPPQSPQLHIENITEAEVILFWSPAEEFGDVSVTGYQLMMNRSAYGAPMDKDQDAIRISGLSAGQIYTFQLAALTDHPIARRDETSIPPFASDFGPELEVNLAGFCQSPQAVFAESITGHSAVIKWKSDINANCNLTRPAEFYEIIWHPAGDFNFQIFSTIVMDEMIRLDELHSGTDYRVVVVAKRTLGGEHQVVWSSSQPFFFATLTPPDGPKNLRVADSCCSGMRLAWSRPVDDNNRIVAFHLSMGLISGAQRDPIRTILPPTADSTRMENLHDGAEYLATLTVVTQEYLSLAGEETLWRQSGQIPIDLRPLGALKLWLPASSIVAVTSGSHPARNLSIFTRTPNSLSLQWCKAQMFGLNELKSTILRWIEAASNTGDCADEVEWEIVSSQVELPSDAERHTITGLIAGLNYRLTVETVVKSKLYLDEETFARDKFESIQICSDPLLTRTLPDFLPLKLTLSGHLDDSFSLKWLGPVLWTESDKISSTGRQIAKRFQFSLVGYKLYVQGDLHKRFNRSATNCRISKCKRGRKYQAYLVAVVVDEGCGLSNTSIQDIEKANVDQMNVHEIRSNPIEFSMPKSAKDSFTKFDCVAMRKEVGSADGQHVATLEWRFGVADGQSLSHFVLTWKCCDDPTVSGKLRLPPDSIGSDVIMPAKCCRTTVTFSVEAVLINKTFVPSQPLGAFIPGNLTPPRIWLKSLELNAITIAWGIGETFGVELEGFYIYVDDHKLDTKIGPTQRCFTLKSVPNKSYKIQLISLSASPDHQNSQLSEPLDIFTGRAIQRYFKKSSTRSDADGNYMPLTIAGNLGNELMLEWTGLPKAIASEVSHFELLWSSDTQPDSHTIKVDPSRCEYRLTRTELGVVHYVRLLLIGKSGELLHQSKELRTETSAPPEKPVVTLKAANLHYVAVEWKVPRTFGFALISGYRVFVDGVSTALLPPGQTEYLATGGQWCKAVGFQVQAISVLDSFDSAMSEILIVLWPGVIAPQLTYSPSVSPNDFKVSWDPPMVTGGVKISHLTLFCTENAEGIVRKPFQQIVGPLHPDSQNVEFTKLPQSVAGFTVVMKIAIQGYSEESASDPILVHPGIAPNPPNLSVSIVGINERRKLELTIAELLNKRDRLLQSIHLQNHECSYGICDLVCNYELYHLADTLYKVEQLASETLKQLEELTGDLVVCLSWRPGQSSPGVNVGKFRVLIDGQQYGPDIMAKITNTRIKLGIGKAKYLAQVQTVSELPEIPSAPSNGVQLNSEPFYPYGFFCLFSVHKKTAEFPAVGCCMYSSTFGQEINIPNHTALCPGPVHIFRTFPPCHAVAVELGSIVPLVNIPVAEGPGQTGQPGRLLPTVVIFYTPWCHSSLKYLSYFMSAASKYDNKFLAISCAVDMQKPIDREELWSLLNDRGYFNVPGKQLIVGGEVCEMLGIYGVPTFIFLHANATLAWQGRYAASSAAQLEKFILHSLSKIAKKPCQVLQCPLCAPLICSTTNADLGPVGKENLSLPIIKRPLAVNPAYPPSFRQFYDPTLAYWAHFNPQKVLERRRLPWYSLASPEDVKRSPRKEKKQLGRGSSSSISPSKSSGDDKVVGGAKQQRRRVPWYEARKIPLKLGGGESSTESAFTPSLASPTSIDSNRRRDEFAADSSLERKKRRKQPTADKTKKD